jgi:polysaccharide export outer membrane protein
VWPYSLGRDAILDPGVCRRVRVLLTDIVWKPIDHTPDACVRGDHHPTSKSMRRSIIPIVLGAVLTAAVVSPASALRQGTTARTSRDSAVSDSALLRPGDIVRLRIWREPDLSGDFPIDEQGVAVFPKIGPTHVVAVTTDSLKRMLVTTYSAYLRDPSIEVTFLRRVTVLGAVKLPGIYPADPTMSISDVVAMAGGALPNGRPHNFELRRGGERIDVDFNEVTPIGRTPIRSGDEIYVPERSWFARNGIYVIGAAVTATAIIVAAGISHGF